LARIAGTDYLEFDPSLPQWTVADAARLGKILADKGVDLIDVSAGGLDSRQQIKYGPGYQVHLAKAVREAVEGTKTVVTTVGNISTATEAQGYMKDGSCDGVFLGRPFLKDPHLVWNWANELKVDIYVATQYGWAFGNTRAYKALNA
jgi:2,4-dienoyl-CoA reductase-like NADH-dependent reductase (Old Yellow Enzyme family)